MFKTASEGCLRALALRFKIRHYLPGHYIIKQGDEVKRLYFIAKGNIEVVKHDETMLTLGWYFANMFFFLTAPKLRVTWNPKKRERNRKTWMMKLFFFFNLHQKNCTIFFSSMHTAKSRIQKKLLMNTHKSFLWFCSLFQDCWIVLLLFPPPLKKWNLNLRRCILSNLINTY